MKILKYILLLTIFISSCKKWGHANVRGTFYLEGTNTPVSDGLVVLTKNWHNGSRSFIDSIRVDASGNFSINYYKNHGYNYIIECSSNTYKKFVEYRLPYKKETINPTISP